ncbi:LysR family transcriptional regulator [Marivita geojedonensis]|uniref:LysR family transcriptional regulator n=1 Tax=Marivita geojedonensis TaxID=1123756 RepID=UPI000D4ADE1F|nr:LysR family transcriptional regulator [Marivita geojedonensis]PRY75861.1 LysR family glycine cleavage system transcriptional activator [Marivita geojedonensis]
MIEKQEKLALSVCFRYAATMTTSLRHLNALRAFEAAARHQSISRAADELNVSHSVVSQHVKNLEAWFGTELFTRSGNRIVLSEDGRALLPRISGGFQTLSDACSDLLRATQKGTLTISAEPALASLWLRKRITEFCDLFPKIDIDLRPAWQPPQLGEGHADLIIHFETRLPAAGVKRHRLFPIDGYPACAPGVRDRLLSQDGKIDWSDAPLIHDNGREIWHNWFVEHEPGKIRWQQGRVYSDLSLAIDAAVDEEGIVLADDILCAKEMKSGMLVRLDDRQIRCVWYSVATPRRASRKAAVDTFTVWLLEKSSALAD